MHLNPKQLLTRPPKCLSAAALVTQKFHRSVERKDADEEEDSRLVAAFKCSPYLQPLAELTLCSLQVASGASVCSAPDWWLCASSAHALFTAGMPEPQSMCQKCSRLCPRPIPTPPSFRATGEA